MPRLTIYLIALTVLLTACSNPSAGGDGILKVGITPNLGFLKQEFHRCASIAPGHALLVEQPPSALNFGEFDAIIHFGHTYPDAAFSTQVGSVKLVFIMNADNPISLLNPAELTTILLGIQTDWHVLDPISFPETTQIHVWSYLKGDDARILVEELLLNGRYMTNSIRLVPDGQAMVTAVMGDPLAIGYIVDGIPHPGVKTLQLDPESMVTGFQPIIASLPMVPEGAVKDLLSCLANQED